MAIRETVPDVDVNEHKHRPSPPSEQQLERGRIPAHVAQNDHRSSRIATKYLGQLRSTLGFQPMDAGILSRYQWGVAMSSSSGLFPAGPRKHDVCRASRFAGRNSITPCTWTRTDRAYTAASSQLVKISRRRRCPDIRAINTTVDVQAAVLSYAAEPELTKITAGPGRCSRNDPPWDPWSRPNSTL